MMQIKLSKPKIASAAKRRRNTSFANIFKNFYKIIYKSMSTMGEQEITSKFRIA